MNLCIFDSDTVIIPPQLKKPGSNDIVIFAAQKDQPAFDGDDGHSPFCHALLSALAEPEKSIDEQVSLISKNLANRRPVAGMADLQIETHVGSDTLGFHLREKDSLYKLEAEALQPKDQGEKITSLEISRGGGLVAISTSGSRGAEGKEKGGSLRILRAKSRRSIDKELLEVKPYCVDFSADSNKVIFGCADGSVGIWKFNASGGRRVSDEIALRQKVSESERVGDTTRIKWLVSPSNETGPVNSIEWGRPHNLIAAGFANGSVAVYEFGKWNEGRTRETQERCVGCLFS